MFTKKKISTTTTVAGLSVGVDAQALAVKAVGVRKATRLFGKRASEIVLNGKIVEIVGQGRGWMWRVKWDNIDDISELSARSLVVDPGSKNPTQSSDSTDSTSETSEEVFLFQFFFPFVWFCLCLLLFTFIYVLAFASLFGLICCVFCRDLI